MCSQFDSESMASGVRLEASIPIYLGEVSHPDACSKGGP